MKKVLFLIGGLSLIFSLVAQDNLTVNIQGLSKDSVYISQMSMSNIESGDALIEVRLDNNTLRYNIEEEGDFLLGIIPKELAINKNGRPKFYPSMLIYPLLVNKNSEINIDAKVVDNNYISYVVAGSKASELYAIHRTEYKDTFMIIIF